MPFPKGHTSFTLLPSIRSLTLHRGIGISLSVSSSLSSVNKKNQLFKSGISRQDGEFLPKVSPVPRASLSGSQSSLGSSVCH